MTNATIGSLRVNLGLDSAEFQEALNKVQRDAKIGMEKTSRAIRQGFSGIGSEVRGELDGIAGQLPIIGNAATAMGGALGAVAVGGLALFTAGLFKAREAMDWAAELTDTANFVGVSAEALQEFRYIADEAGVPIADMEDGLKALNVALGAMQTGVANKKTAKVFEALGLTADDLKPMKDARDLLPVVADRISKLGTQAQQAQIAEKLGIGKLLPVLQQGSAKLEQMAKDARALGLVLSNDTVKGLDDAQRKAEVASQVIDTQLKASFANLAPVISGTTQALADGTKVLAGWLEQAGKVIDIGKMRGSARLEGLNKGLSGQALNEYIDTTVANRRAIEGRRRREDLKAAYNNRLGASTPSAIPPSVASEVDRKSSKSSALTDAQKEAQRLAQMTALTRQMDVLNKSYDAGKIKADEYAKSIDRLDMAYGKLAGDIRQTKGLSNDLMLDGSMSGFVLAADRFKDVSREVANVIPEMAGGAELAASKFEDLAVSLGQDFADVFANVISGTEDAGDAFDRMLRRMVNSMAYSGFLQLFGISEDGKSTGGGLIGLLTGKSSAFMPGESSQSGGLGGFDPFALLKTGLGKIGGIGSILGPVLSKLPGFAAGTLRAPGGLSWVGEQGPELMNVPRGAQVFPSDLSAALMDGGAGGGSFAVEVVPSPYFDVKVKKVAQPLADDAAVRGATGGANIAAARAARSNSKRLV